MKKLKGDYPRRKLPHIYPADASFFITFRLYGAIPKPVLKQLWQEQVQKRKEMPKKYSPSSEGSLFEGEKGYFLAVDQALDRYRRQDDFLKNPEIARIVADKIHTYDGKYYDLVAYCLMPNHVHLLIKTEGYASSMPKYSLSRIMQFIKGGTARTGNQVLGRQGSFWEEESYDHYLRNPQEFENILAYILDDPVKAGLVEHWEEYPFTFLWEGGF